MKLNLPILDESILIDGARIFTIEDATLFGKVIRQLYDLDDNSELKIFTEQQKRLQSKDILVIVDVMQYDGNSTTIQKSVISDIEEQLSLNPDKKNTLDELTNKIYNLLDFEIVNHELDLDITIPNIQQMLKLFQPRILLDVTTIFEKIFSIIKVYTYLQSKLSLLVFVNLSTYLTTEQFKRIIEYVDLSNISVLFLERNPVTDTKQYILDEDFFFLNQYQ